MLPKIRDGWTGHAYVGALLLGVGLMLVLNALFTDIGRLLVVPGGLLTVIGAYRIQEALE